MVKVFSINDENFRPPQRRLKQSTIGAGFHLYVRMHGTCALKDAKSGRVGLKSVTTHAHTQTRPQLDQLLRHVAVGHGLL